MAGRLCKKGVSTLRGRGRARQVPRDRFLPDLPLVDAHADEPASATSLAISGKQCLANGHDKRARACHSLVVTDEAPGWDVLRQRLTRAPFSPAGVAAVGRAIDRAEQLLGPSWPRRQFEHKGWWPGEFNLLGFHVAALPQFLALVLRLEAAVEEPTFAPVLRGLKRGATSAD